MALDGIFLSRIKDELSENAVGTKVDKIQQPSKDEFVFHLRSRNANYMLLVCVRADSPRIHFTSHKIDSPAVPPMFCMLLRKRLGGAVISSFRQLGLDRVLFVDFDATNEIGDKIKLTLVIEIMGKCSNLILIDENQKIIDCAKRVDITTSSVRQLLPGLKYELPPQQMKRNIESDNIELIVQTIKSFSSAKLSGAVLSSLEGVSPIVAREIAYNCCENDLQVNQLNEEHFNKLIYQLEKLRNALHCKDKVYMLCHNDLRPKDFSFLKINQYCGQLILKEYESCCELLDDFYFERDRINRINHRARELIRLLNNLVERTSKKINIQKAELEKCAEKDTLKLYGELITANIHLLKKGSLFYEVPNYYDNMNIVRISCNPALTPTENANKLYKEYRKAKTAEVMLEKLIVEATAEVSYLETVLDAISRADTDSEISIIRAELCDGGYLKNKNTKKQKAPKELAPIEYCSSDGYRILVGRNNIQNDKLSLKTANKNDMWLHTQAFPGSHVIIENKDGEVSDLSIEEAAVIAVNHSKASESSLVAVDYTPVKNLKKPVGAKPGKVIYHRYYSIITNPDKNLCKKLLVKK